MRKVAAVLLFALGGCTTSGFERFYAPVDRSNSTTRAEFYRGPPEISPSSGNGRQDIDDMWANGYVLIGQSSFNGPPEDNKNALSLAKKIGARFVIVISRYAYTRSGYTPITSPTTSTAIESGFFSVNDFNGPTSGSFSGTITTQGQITSYIPHNVSRYDQDAGFFAAAERRGLGALVNLIIEKSSAANVNPRAIVRSVRRGSPAFSAGIISGDILKSVDDIEIFDSTSLRAALRQPYGRQSVVRIVRNGVSMNIPLKMSSEGIW